MKIVIIVSKSNNLVGTVSDGDIRRGLLKGLRLESPVASIIQRNPLVVPHGLSRSIVLELMTVNGVQQIPVVDGANCVVDLHFWDELLSPVCRSNIMVIMAGGFGKRLHPHTKDCPKPMLKVAKKPILQHIVERAKEQGIKNFLISLNYLGEIIEEYFGNGANFGVSIEYIRENSPLGTAGALSLIKTLPLSPIIITNGDVISDIRYDELIDFHTRNGGEATMAVRLHESQHPFGVVELDGVKIIGFKEKPITLEYINAGIYVLEPSTLKLLKENEHCDMPTLFEKISANAMTAYAYPMHEPWLDVGRPDDLIKANKIS